MAIPLRPFGRHAGVQVSSLALGGYHLGALPGAREAVRITHAAIDAGITFMDNAWEYNDHQSEIRMGRAIADRRDRVFLMTKVCTHGRGAKVAMRQLEDSLRRLKTDHIDLWQIHECVYDNEPALHFARGGVVEALDRAKKDGKVRFTGFTGHKDPAIHLEMLSHGYPFDACQLPLNVFDATFRSFEQRVLPELLLQGIAPLGMKSLCGTGNPVKRRAVTAEEALRYVLSLPIATLVSGIDSMRVLKQNVGIASAFTPFSDAQMARLRKKVADVAADGRFERHKTTATHEGDEGRAQHGFPLVAEMGG